MKHRHHDLIIAWVADTNRAVQYEHPHEGWVDVKGTPLWTNEYDYRFKPEIQPDHVTDCKVLGIYKSILWNSTRETVPGANLRLTFSGVDGSLIKAEVLK